MNDYTIRTDGLSIDFDALRAVDGLSLEIPSGCVFGFLGPNGAGKTTTIRLLLGLLEPSAGRAEVLGFDSRAQANEIRARTGALLEHNGLYERLSAEENLQFMGRIFRMPASQRDARVEELLNHLDLWERRKEKVGAWSRGMKQKLAVARALFHRPSLVFLDEPTAGFDPEAAASLRNDLSSIVEQEGVTVFITTHNLVEAEKLCSQVGVIRKGKLIAVGSPNQLRSSAGSLQVEIVAEGFTDNLLNEICERPGVQSVQSQNGKTVVEMDAGSRTAPLVRWLVENGVELEEVRKGESSLEDAYLALMEDGEK